MARVQRREPATARGGGPADLACCEALLGEYDFLGFVDASVVAIAERLKLRTLLTTDRRDFHRVKPRHIRAFELLP